RRQFFELRRQRLAQALGFSCRLSQRRRPPPRAAADQAGGDGEAPWQSPAPLLASEQPVEKSREGKLERDLVGDRLGELEGFGDLGGRAPRCHAIVVLAAQKPSGLCRLAAHPVADCCARQTGELAQLLDAELGKLLAPFRA